MTIVRIDEGARMSQAVVHGDTVYLAGQVGTPGDSVEAQTRQVLASIDDLLARAGSGRDRLLRATILLADMADYDAMNRVWDEWVRDVGKPVRATYGVGPATPRHAVEIIATAAYGDTRPADDDTRRGSPLNRRRGRGRQAQYP